MELREDILWAVGLCFEPNSQFLPLGNFMLIPFRHLNLLVVLGTNPTLETRHRMGLSSTQLKHFP